VIDLGVLNGLLYFFPTKQSIILAIYNTIAYGLAVLNSYILNSKYTFKVKKNPKQFIAFLVQALFSLVIADFVLVFGMWLFSFTSSFPDWLKTNISKLVSMFISSTASYFFIKYIVFRKQLVAGKNMEESNQ
jgi:putative flippase GtrA